MGVYYDNHYKSALDTIKRIFEEKSQVDKTMLCWSIIELPGMNYELESWRAVMSKINDSAVRQLWSAIEHKNEGGSRAQWEFEIIKKLSSSLRISELAVHLIPAIRQVGKKGSSSESEYDGTGIIDRLARLQNPDVHNQAERKKFEDITTFVRSVLDRNDAKIEIPYERDTILLHMDNKVLPLDSLGTGVLKSSYSRRLRRF